MDLVKHVDLALYGARHDYPDLPQWILDITGFSTPTMRRLFNAICNGKFTYCEVGVFAGGTFFSAVYGNKDLTAIGFEDFSQSFGKDNIKHELHENLLRIDLLQADVIESDFFAWKPDRITDIFFYDGNHDYKNQYRALPFIYKNLSKSFLYIVDDYNWPVVHVATRESLLSREGLTIDHEWTLVGEKLNDDPIWHNGLFIAACTKT